jgi:hypothetical protein
MRDSLEDRIHQDGKHDEFSAAIAKFRKSKKTRDDQQDLYDKLEQLGANPEEADEFVNMELENAQ